MERLWNCWSYQSNLTNGCSPLSLSNMFSYHFQLCMILEFFSFFFSHVYEEFSDVNVHVELAIVGYLIRPNFLLASIY